MNKKQQVKNSGVQQWDFQARWKGALSQEERQQLSVWMKRERPLAAIEMKLGASRSRLSVRFERHHVMQEVKRQVDHVRELMSQQIEDKEAVLAIKELQEADPEAINGQLVRSYTEVVLREWTGKHAGALGGLIPVRCGLSIALGNTKQ